MDVLLIICGMVAIIAGFIALFTDTLMGMGIIGVGLFLGILAIYFQASGHQNEINELKGMVLAQFNHTHSTSGPVTQLTPNWSGDVFSNVYQVLPNQPTETLIYPNFPQPPTSS
jgi:hypothetical protein